MELMSEINKIINSEKFQGLEDAQKQTIKESILANSLILSRENQKRYFELLRNNLIEIEDLGREYYYKNNLCYAGIVSTEISRTPIDEEGMIFPINYKLKYREYSEPVGRLTRSVLHEFGHLVIKKSKINLLDTKKSIHDGLLIDLGGLVISKNLQINFGHTFSEVINEFTNFLAFKSYLAYQEGYEKSEEKMREFAKQNGLAIERSIPHLDILPKNLFDTYSESDLANHPFPEGTTEMFNPLYVKYTPLVRLIMHAFQNPCYSYQDLEASFKKEQGLSATKNKEPINDLLFGYYESSFHPLEIFDKFMKEKIDWETYCIEFDKEIYEKNINQDFVAKSLEYFTEFYEKRNAFYLSNQRITKEELEKNMQDFTKTVEACQRYYSENRTRET